MTVASNRLVASIGALLLAASTLGGCVDERAFYMTLAASACDSSGRTPARGILDVNGKVGYRIYPNLQNDLTATAGSQPERNRLVLRRFEVDIDVSGLGPDAAARVRAQSPLSFDLEATAVIQPASSVSLSGVPIIADSLIASLEFPTNISPVVIVSKIRAVADHNGAEIKSVELSFPVELCRGCLITDLGACADLKQPSQGASVTNECGLPQDTRVGCCDTTAPTPRCLTKDEISALPTE